MKQLVNITIFKGDISLWGKEKRMKLQQPTLYKAVYHVKIVFYIPAHMGT